MDQFEIKPGLISRNSLVLFFILIVVVAGIVLPLYPRLIELRECAACDQTPFIIVTTVTFGIFLGLLFVAISLKNRKIRVDNNLVSFMKKPWFKGWIIDRLIDFSKVDIVKDRKEQHFTGKAVITYHWLVFMMNDKSKQELLINGYDYSGIKNMFYYVRGKFPEVKFDNDLFRDSPEKLADLKIS